MVMALARAVRGVVHGQVDLGLHFPLDPPQPGDFFPQKIQVLQPHNCIGRNFATKFLRFPQQEVPERKTMLP